MRYVICVGFVAYLVARLLMSGKAEEDILRDEIAKSNQELEESIGDPDQLPWKQQNHPSTENVVSLTYSH